MDSKHKAHKQSAQLNKRKRGILRKAMELSKLCGQQIYIAIGDPSSKTLAEYKSEQNLTLKGYENFEVFDSGDYEDLNNKYVNNKKYVEIQNKHRHELEQKKLAKQNAVPDLTIKYESDSKSSISAKT